MFRWGGASDEGRVRAINQDSLLATTGLYVVADGMGGHRGGEVASAIAVDTMAETETPATVRAVVEAVEAANRAIFDRSSAEAELHGMGTTLCALALVRTESGREGLAVVNVGDSRVYRHADGLLEQVTEDHSMVEQMVRDGLLTPAEAETHPQRNILTRALGIDPRLSIDVWILPVRSGERFLLCSDGLFNEVEPDAIARVLATLADPVEAADELVELANDAGSRDNVTVVVVDVVAGASTGREELPATPTVVEITEDGLDFGEPTQPVPVVGGRRKRRWPWSRG